jgi:hypothetical protein
MDFSVSDLYFKNMNENNIVQIIEINEANVILKNSKSEIITIVNENIEINNDVTSYNK